MRETQFMLRPRLDIECVDAVFAEQALGDNLGVLRAEHLQFGNLAEPLVPS